MDIMSNFQPAAGFSTTDARGSRALAFETNPTLQNMAYDLPRYGVPVSDAEDLETDGLTTLPKSPEVVPDGARHLEPMTILFNEPTVPIVDLGPSAPNQPTVPVAGVRPKRELQAQVVPQESLSHEMQEMEVQTVSLPNDSEENRPTVPSVALTDFRATDYNTQYANRGRAIIIANIDYYDEEERRSRTGSKRDAEALEAVFRQLQFEPVCVRSGAEPTFIHRNLNRQQIKELMEDASNAALNDYRNYDCFMCVILSYGIEGAIMCRESYGDDLMDFNEVVEPFLGSKCPSLVLKPKMFFVQCCPPYERTMADTTAIDAEDVEGSRGYRFSLPTHADVLIQFSGLPGNYGWIRNRRKGLSWYIECLVKALKKFCIERMQLKGKSVEFSSIMLRVNKYVLDLIEMEGLSASEEFGVPVVKSTLTKNLFFYPKENSGETAV